MQEEIKEMIDKIKKCLIAGYDLDIITQEEMGILWNYITNLQEELRIRDTNWQSLKYYLEKLYNKDYIEEEIFDDICKRVNELENQIEIKSYQKEITNLQEKYDKALELLVDFNMPCEIDDFNLLDTDYCELNCSVDDEQYKKCWNKFIEWRLQGVDKE